MKKILCLSLVMAFCLLGNSIIAQDKIATPKWLSDKGYWVIESNAKEKQHQVIWFFNNDNVVVYKETVEGSKLKHAKRKVRMKLKRILDSAVAAFENSNKKEFPAEQDLVKTVL